MNVLVISAHPDDMEIFCGGTLLRCKKRGDNVTVCHFANGNMGHVVIKPEELGPMRAAEAEKACELGGFKSITCDIGDLHVNAADKSQHDKIVKVIRDAAPDFIITQGPDDYMGDHTELSTLVFKASFAASVPQYEPQLGPACDVTPIYYMDNEVLLGGDPTEYVDISDEMETKLQMLSFHKSQLTWLEDHDGVDVLETTKVLSRMRGIQCGVMYAEGYRAINVGQRMTTKRLLP